MKTNARFSIVAVLVILVALVLAPAAQAADGPQAIVNTAALNVRQGPGTAYTVLTVVYAGASLAVTGQNTAAGWYQISLADGRTGWVAGTLVNVSGTTDGLPEVAAPALAAGAAAGHSSSMRQGSLIVFQTTSGGAIYAVNPDGTNLHFLTNGIDPALSPDGRWVALTRWEGQSNGAAGSLWVIGVDGSGERQVMSETNQPKSPTWSADGQQIIVSMQQGGTIDNTYVCNVDGKPVAVPLPIPGARCQLQRADPYWGLRVVNVNTGAFEDLKHDRHSFAPTWDPTNAWHVVYRGDLGLVNLDINQENTWLLQKSGAQRGPVFSPDGTKIATTFHQNDHWEIHVMNADGSDEVRLTETPFNVIVESELQGQAARLWNNAAPAWSPDGSQIAFLTDRSGIYEIWVMNADGSDQHPLMSPAVMDGLGLHYDGMEERAISWR